MMTRYALRLVLLRAGLIGPVLGSFIFGLALILVAASLPVGVGAVEVAVDVEAPQGSIIRLYWNDWRTPTPPTSSVGLGTRRVVNLALPPEDIYSLRIDPLGVPNSKVIIYGVTIKLTDGATMQIAPSSLATWNFVNTTKPELTNGALVFTTTDAAFLYHEVQLPRQGVLHQWVTLIKTELRSFVFAFEFLVVGALIAACAAMGLRFALPFAALMLLSLPILYYGTSLLQYLLPADRAEVAIAIGRAAYTGQSLQPVRWGTVIASLCALILAWLAARMLRPAFGRLASTGAVSGGRLFPTWGLPVVWAVFMLLLFMPDLAAITSNTLTQKFYFNWDSNNHWAWQGFVARGDRPFVDFWYPYAGVWMFFLPLPSGPLMQLLHYVLLFSVIGVSVWRLFERALIESVVVLAFLLVLTTAGVLESAERYMLSVAVVLAYAAVDRDKRIAVSGRLWFYLAYGLALWAEPAQLAYAAPAVLFALVVDEIRRGPIVVREAIWRLIRDGMGVLIITVALVLFFAARGELAGVVDNTYDLLAGGIYGALPTTLDVAFRTHPGAIVSITAPFALLFVGAYLSAKRGGAAAIRLGAAIAGCGIIGIMVDQKYFIRGPLGGQIFDTTAVGVLLLLAVLIRSSRLGRIAAWVTVGAMTAIVVNNANLWRPGYERVSAAVGRTDRTIRTLGEPALMKQANEHAFDKERFADFHEEMKIVEWMQARAMKGLYVMGDVPILYLFQPSPPPYQVNIYNTSPMRAQLQVRSWIRERQPQMVVLDPRAVSFDGVPHIVRVPILTAEVILNYVPETTIGPYRILTRREGKPIPFEFWQGIYGASIDFGYLLQQSRNPRWPDCTANKPQDEQCLRYLWLRFAQDVGTDTRVVLPVQVGSAKFEISFVRRPGASEYFVPLDRIWFWLAAETSGIGAQIQIPDGLVAEHRYVGKKPPAPALY